MSFVKPTLRVFGRCELKRSSEEEVKVVNKRHLICADHTVGCAAAAGTSHTA